MGRSFLDYWHAVLAALGLDTKLKPSPALSASGACANCTASAKPRNIMPLITDSEMEDFDAAILQAGFEVDDFNVVDLQDDGVPLGDDETTVTAQHPITGTVTVHRISTGEAITYSAGHLSTWVTEFEIDVHEGKFGEP